MAKTVWHATRYPGIRYREHSTRKHGVRRDRYYALHYKYRGTFYDEPVGWDTDAKPTDDETTLEKAVRYFATIKRNRVEGGPVTLRELKNLSEEQRQAKHKEDRLRALQGITLEQFFNDRYYPVAQTSKKAVTYEKEEMLFRLWVKPQLGQKPLRDITQIDLERLKKHMLDKKKSTKTIMLTLALVRQMWNQARREEIVSNESPTKAVRLPKKDNRRLRFLTHAEADNILAHLKDLRGKNKQLHNITLLSLHTGMRANEIFSLTWADIHEARGEISIRDPKAGKNRKAYMTPEVKAMFEALVHGEPSELVFKDKRHGGKIKEISHAFREAIDELKLNDGIKDPRQKVVFHTCRHSFASWLAEAGADPFTIMTLMGHHSLTMVTRYTHLDEGGLQEAVRRLVADIEKNKPEEAGDLPSEQIPEPDTKVVTLKRGS